MRMNLQDDVLVFLIDPFVGYDGPDELADQPLGISVRVTDPERGVRILVGRRNRHGFAEFRLISRRSIAHRTASVHMGGP